MEKPGMTDLLTAEEEKIRNELRADMDIDQNRRQSVERLKSQYSDLLLRYNAMNGGDRVRQAMADCLTATAQDGLSLLMAGQAKKEIAKRKLQPGAVIGLLMSVIFCLLAALLVQKTFIAGCVCVVCAVFCAFLSGRLWYGERSVKVRTEIDADSVWNTLRKTAGTMDRKIAEFCSLAEGWEKEAAEKNAPQKEKVFDESELKLFGDLLEALYADNGDYALRQLKQVRAFLRAQGIELRDYTPGEEELFELLPTKNASATQRPALLKGESLLLVGRATEHIR
ncbi:MAG: hypothetical protein IJQ02_01410 [Oscillospiraceae bacterium]|nr:hypothetical protein [Oscillospiraceae bacterium]